MPSVWHRQCCQCHVTQMHFVHARSLAAAKSGALPTHPKARAVCCIPEQQIAMGGRVIWEGGRPPGPRERLNFFSNLAAPSLIAGKGSPSNLAQLEAPQSTALTPRGAASGSDFQSRHLSDFLAGGRGEGQMWLGDAKGKAVRQADLPGRSLGPEGASACFPRAH